MIYQYITNWIRYLTSFNNWVFVKTVKARAFFHRGYYVLVEIIEAANIGLVYSVANPSQKSCPP